MLTSIWLRPAAEVATWLDAAIADIAGVAGHTVFGSHLTVATGPGLADERMMRDLSAKCAPLTLMPSGLLQTEQFTRTFAVAFARTEALVRLRDKALTALGGRDDAPFLPHVSLIYGRAEVAGLLEAAAARLNGPVVFDRICAVEAPVHNVSQADVAAWRAGPEYVLTD